MKKIIKIKTIIIMLAMTLLIQNYTNFASASDYDALSWPAPSKKISSLFGQRDGKMHLGIDVTFIKANVDLIKSSISGKVMYSGSDVGTYGNLVVINGYDRYYGDNPNGAPYIDMPIQTRYAHLDSRNVSEGNSVTTTTNIGVLGNTGYSTGPHLHYETRIANSINSSYSESQSVAIDPVYYFHYNVQLTYPSLRATIEKSNNSSVVLIDDNGNVGIYKWPIFMTLDYIHENPTEAITEFGINKYDLLNLASYVKNNPESYQLLLFKAQEVTMLENTQEAKIIKY